MKLLTVTTGEAIMIGCKRNSGRNPATCTNHPSKGGPCRACSDPDSGDPALEFATTGIQKVVWQQTKGPVTMVTGRPNFGPW